MAKGNYNIASRAAQSNSVHVSVLKIPIVHADSVSKSLRQKFFFSRERPLLARGKIIYFATIMDTNRDSAHQSQNEDNFPTFFLGLEFLNEAEKEKNNGKGDSVSAPSRFASLHLIFHSPRTITSDIVVRFSRRIWCTIPSAMHEPIIKLKLLRVINVSSYRGLHTKTISRLKVGFMITLNKCKES